MSTDGVRSVEIVDGQGLTPKDLKHAGLVACGYSEGPEEARMFLDMLGLTEDLRSTNSSERV